MSKLSPEVIERLGPLQEQLWQNATSAVAAVSEDPIQFSPGAPESAMPEIARALAGETALSIQFAFASLPDNNQLIVIQRDSFANLASFVKGEEIHEPDESLIPDLRGFFEGIVQGICLTCGIAKNEPMVASGLSIRYQTLTLPDNFGRNDDLVKIDCTFSAPNLEGSLSWFMDNRTAEYITGWEGSGETQGGQSQSLSSAPDALPLIAGPEEVGGLDLLMDIPLEISVELGRVKMLVKDVVELGTGSVVEIDKAAGEPVDVMVNGRLVARGEVVVIEDNFGVRITEILTAQERITRLGEAA